MTIIIAADHAGFEMKERIKVYLEKEGHIVEDVGAHSFDPNDDYPFYMKEAAKRVVGSDVVGIVFGGSGQGEAMVMNRFSGIRAMVYAAPDLELIQVGREHNDANVLSVGARFLSYAQAEAAVVLFLSTPFPGDARHVRRIANV